VVRERILEAAFAAFMKSGYATTSTLEIATRARFEASFTR
jgi:AcrR family transcriptional regulator